MSTIAEFTPVLRTLQRGESLSLPYVLENERLLYLISGDAQITLQMHFKINSLGMLEAVSTNLELNDQGQLVPTLNVVPETLPLSAQNCYAIPQGCEIEIKALSSLSFFLIEGLATGLLNFISVANNPEGQLNKPSENAILEISPESAPIATQDDFTSPEPERVPEYLESSTATVATQVTSKTELKPKAIQNEPRQRFYYYSTQNRAFFFIKLFAIFFAAIVFISLLPNVFGMVVLVMSLIYVCQMLYWEFADIRDNQPAISLVTDGLILHTRTYRQMPLIWSEVYDLNLVVRENSLNSGIALEIVLARPDTKINYLNPMLKWFFGHLVKGGQAVDLPKIYFLESDFDIDAETLKRHLMFSKDSYSAN